MYEKEDMGVDTVLSMLRNDVNESGKLMQEFITWPRL